MLLGARSHLSKEICWTGFLPRPVLATQLVGSSLHTHVVLAREKPFLVAQQLDVPDEGIPHSCS